MHEFSSFLLTSTRRARLPAGARRAPRRRASSRRRVRETRASPKAAASRFSSRRRRRGRPWPLSRPPRAPPRSSGARIRVSWSPHTWLSMTIASASASRAPARRSRQHGIETAVGGLPSPCAETPPRAAFPRRRARRPQRFVLRDGVERGGRRALDIREFVVFVPGRRSGGDGGAQRHAEKGIDEARARVAPPRHCAAVFAARRSASTHGPISPWHSRSCAMA